MGRTFVSLFKNKIVKMAIFIALLGTSILIALAMLLGKEAGNFVIKVQDANSEKSIALALNPDDFEAYQSKLSADGMVGMTDYSSNLFIQSGFKTLDRLTAESGSYTEQGKSLYCYTFYIVNTSNSGNVQVTADLRYSGATRNVEKAIRCMTYAVTSSDREPFIYKFVDYSLSTEERQNLSDREDKGYVITPQSFKRKLVDEDDTTEGIVFDDQTYVIGETIAEDSTNNYLKYSVFFWLEGNDPDCNEENGVLGGTIKFDLTFTVTG